MTSRKRSARKRQVEEFKAGLSSDLDASCRRFGSAQGTLDQRREAAYRKKSCESKQRYDSRAEAEDTIQACAEHGRTGLSCYRCEFCGGWHLTSHPRET